MNRPYQALIRGCVKQDPHAQRELYDLFAPRMLVVCYRYAASAAEAEDILQEGFIKVYQSIKKYKDRGSFEGWIRRIMINTAIDILRKERHAHHQLELNETITEDDQEDALDQLEAEYVLDVIQGLPDGYRMVFNLYAIEGYSHAEIGKKLQISESTSRSQYTRARSMLKRKLVDSRTYQHSYRDVS
ncbi:MAG: sigma-70 family RNA polymerase sigma factor [Bacteroidota bacterium]